MHCDITSVDTQNLRVTVLSPWSPHTAQECVSVGGDGSPTLHDSHGPGEEYNTLYTENGADVK